MTLKAEIIMLDQHFISMAHHAVALIAVTILISPGILFAEESPLPPIDAFAPLKTQTPAALKGERTNGEEGPMLVFHEAEYGMLPAEERIAIPLVAAPPNPACGSLHAYDPKIPTMWWIFDGDEPIALSLDIKAGATLWRHQAAKKCFERWPLTTFEACKKFSPSGKILAKAQHQKTDPPATFRLPVELDGGQMTVFDALIEHPDFFQYIIRADAQSPDGLKNVELFTFEDGSDGSNSLNVYEESSGRVVVYIESMSETMAMFRAGPGETFDESIYSWAIWSPQLHVFQGVHSRESVTETAETDFDRSEYHRLTERCHAQLDAVGRIRIGFNRDVENKKEEEYTLDCEHDPMCKKVCTETTVKDRNKIEWSIEQDGESHILIYDLSAKHDETQRKGEKCELSKASP